MSIPTPDPLSPAWSIYIDNQPFNLTALDGTQITFTLTTVNDAMYFIIAQTAGYAFSIGFSGMLLIILGLLTTREKAKRPIFILNVLSLIIILVRSIIYAVVVCANYQHGIGEYLLGAIAQYTVATFAPSIMIGLLNPLLYITMLSSLVLQVRVVFAAEPTTQKILTVVMAGAAFVIVAFGVTFNAYFIQMQVDGIASAESGWVYNVVRIGIIIFIGISCLLFLYKLAITIRRRRRMGFQKFGPLQILFIMFGQCLVIPCTSPSLSLFASILMGLIVLLYILDFNLTSVNNLSGLAQTFLVCSLPLSALWASHESDNNKPRVTTTSSSVTDSSRSSRFRNRFRFLKNKGSESQSVDLEKAPSYEEKSLSSSPRVENLHPVDRE